MTTTHKIACLVVLIVSLILSCQWERPETIETSPAVAKRSTPPPQPIVEARDPEQAPLADPSSATAPSGPTTEERLERLRLSEIVGGRLVSGRTLSAKLRLTGGSKAVFKPLRRGDMRALREVAIFRLAELFGVEGVPASTVRRLPLKRLTALIARKHPDEAGALESTARTDAKGMVTGAIIEWVDNLDPDLYSELGGRTTMMSWLAPARPAGEEPALAAHASAMVVFDYLTGNWDRFSGGNLFVTRDGDRLVLLDHNATFAPGNKRQSRRLAKLLAETERFPAGLVERLRTLTAEQVDLALSREPVHRRRPLINAAEVAMLLERRDEIVNHVDRLIAVHDATSVLPFP